MSIIFDALKKVQMKFTSQRGKDSGENSKKPEEKKPSSPSGTSSSNFSADEDLTQPIKPIPGARSIKEQKNSEDKEAPTVKLRRTWNIYDVRHMNPFAFIVMILFGLLGCALVFYIFNYKLKDKYFIQAEIDADSAAGTAEGGLSQAERPTKNLFFLSPEISLTLDGILSSEGENLALIDDEILKVGDAIKGAKIISIGIDEVELFFGGKKFTLPLGK